MISSVANSVALFFIFLALAGGAIKYYNQIKEVYGGVITLLLSPVWFFSYLFYFSGFAYIVLAIVEGDYMQILTLIVAIVVLSISYYVMRYVITTFHSENFWMITKFIYANPFGLFLFFSLNVPIKIGMRFWEYVFGAYNTKIDSLNAERKREMQKQRLAESVQESSDNRSTEEIDETNLAADDDVMYIQ